MNFIVNETKKKLRGGYYTPVDLAEFLVRWVKEIKPKKILEPSCGDGIFFEAIKKVGGLSRATLVGIEFDGKNYKEILHYSDIPEIGKVIDYNREERFYIDLFEKNSFRLIKKENLGDSGFICTIFIFERSK